MNYFCNCLDIKQISIKKVSETNEVQGYFELICFDLVSSPSTPGAYLFNDPSERGNFEENLEEEIREREMNNEKGLGRSIDLMSKLSHYLDK